MEHSSVDNTVDSARIGTVVQAGDVGGSVIVVSAPPLAAQRPLRQLPPARPIVDREGVLAELDALYHRGTTSSRVLVVAGAPGVGLRTAALAWAHRHASEFEAHAVVSVTSGLYAAQGVLLTALGLDPDRLPHEIGDRAAWWRHHTSGTRTLVVAVDPPPGIAGVEALLPGAAGSVVLVASHHPVLDRTGVPHPPVSVGAMTDDHLRELVSRMLGDQRVASDPEGVQALVARCAGLPLAARIVAGVVGLRHPNAPLSQIADRLDLTAGLATQMGPIMDQAYAALPEDAVPLYRAIGACDLTELTRGLAMALLGGDATTVDRALEALVIAGLADEIEPDLYRVRDLAREHARAMAQSADPAAARTALVLRAARYLEPILRLANRTSGRDLGPAPTADSADAQPDTPFDGMSPTQALDWIEQRRQIVIHLCQATLDQGLPLWTEWLGTALWVVTEWRGDRELRDLLSGIRRAAAQLSQDPHALRRAIGRIGQDYTEAGEWDAALPYLLESRALAAAADDPAAPRDRRTADKRLANWHVLRGRERLLQSDPRGLDDLREADNGLTVLIADYEAAGLLGKAAAALTMRAQARLGADRRLDALRDSERAIELVLHHGDQLHEARARITHAEILTAWGDVPAARGELAKIEQSAAARALPPRDQARWSDLDSIFDDSAT
ncbi:putative PE-PGRS family protein [Kutzneria sp. 744]|nr:putative PE-PGRS family protein [Kutzneria sp. 744]